MTADASLGHRSATATVGALSGVGVGVGTGVFLVGCCSEDKEVCSFCFVLTRFFDVQ